MHISVHRGKFRTDRYYYENNSFNYGQFRSVAFFLGVGPNTVFRISVNLGEYPLPHWDETSRGGSGYFPKLPKRVCAAQQGRDFGTLSFTAKLGLSCFVSTCLLLWDVWVKN